MRLDHVSYVASHEQISDVVQRIGSQIGTAFVDGGIHPQFGTRNFTAPLLNGQYIEVVCALDHPAAEKTPFGQAVSKKAAEGGGWLTWVFATNDLDPIEKAIGRPSIEGHRRRPDGTELRWKQVGVKTLLEEPDQPFYIQWLSNSHPSSNGDARSSIHEIVFNGQNREIIKSPWFDYLPKQNIPIINFEPDLAEYLSSGIAFIKFELGGDLVKIE